MVPSPSTKSCVADLRRTEILTTCRQGPSGTHTICIGRNYGTCTRTNQSEKSRWRALITTWRGASGATGGIKSLPKSTIFSDAIFLLIRFMALWGSCSCLHSQEPSEFCLKETVWGLCCFALGAWYCLSPASLYQYQSLDSCLVYVKFMIKRMWCAEFKAGSKRHMSSLTLIYHDTVK